MYNRPVVPPTTSAQRLGRYHLVRLVGTGGMAEIWKAKAQGPAGFEKVVAIKKVLSQLVQEGEFTEMFVEEAKLVATLAHPNIVQVFDFGQVGRADYFIAMEYVPGGNLAQLLHRLKEAGSRLPREVGLYIGVEACKGLGFAHTKTDATGKPLNIVHRDVSPQNVLMSFGGEVKVSDFGIAKVASALSRTQTGHVRGKLAYMSPEQVSMQPLDNRSDLFALGAVIYEMLVGDRLFWATGAHELYQKLSTFRGPDERALEKVGEDVARILRTVLQPRAADRFADAVQLEAALTAALGVDGIVQARRALASMMQRLFAEELKHESEPDPVLPERPDEATTLPAEPPTATVDELSLKRNIRRMEATTATGPGASTPGPTDARALAAARARGGAAGTASRGSAATGEGLETAVDRRPPARGAEDGVAGPTMVSKHQPVPAVAVKVDPRGERTSVAQIRPWWGPAVVAGIVVLALAAFGIYTRPTTRVASTAPPAAGGTASVPVIATAPAAPKSVPVAAPAALPAAAPASLAAPPIAGAAPSTTPIRAPVEALPGASRKAPAKVETGALTVTARPWVEIWVDGKKVAGESVRGHRLPAGRHSLRLINATAGFDRSMSIEVPADGELRFAVDVKAGTVRAVSP